MVFLQNDVRVCVQANNITLSTCFRCAKSLYLILLILQFKIKFWKFLSPMPRMKELLVCKEINIYDHSDFWPWKFITRIQFIATMTAICL